MCLLVPAGASVGLPQNSLNLSLGTPMSTERIALITAFREKAAGLANKFESRTHKSTWVMPYRLFRPAEAGKAPLVLYLHGSGGLGDDNQKQIAGGNLFGTHVWALPENQKRNPCYVLAPQTNRGWLRYEHLPTIGGGEPKILPGFGDGAHLVQEIIEALCREFPIDERRVYVTGQSMGGGGTWHMAHDRASSKVVRGGRAMLRK